MALGANLKISIFDPPNVGGTYEVGQSLSLTLEPDSKCYYLDVPQVEDTTLLREVDLRQLVEKAQLSGELVTMCLESAFELQAGTSAHTKRSLIE